MLKKYFERWGSRGQVLVLYALLLPILFLFFGAVFDFGWLYFNQSKLQNAADAAVVAGAYELVKTDETLKDYKVINFISENNSAFQNFIADDKISMSKLKTNGLAEAQDYTNFNIKNMSTVQINATEDILYTDKKISYEDAYYEVILSGSVEHLFGFMQSKFGSMTIKAAAVAKLTQGVDLLSQLKGIKKGDKDKGILPKIMYDWERDKKERNVDNNSYAQKRTVRSKNRSIDYVDGNLYRTETITLNGTGESGDGMEVTGDAHVRTNMAKPQFKDFDGTGTKEWRYGVDDLYIDFRPDLNYNSTGFTEDWDIGNGARSGLKYAFQNRQSPFASVEKEITLDYAPQFDLRILATINFDEPYEVRDQFDKNGNEIKDNQGNSLLETDPLYIRIESEPIYNDGTTTSHSSVRQIIININADNTVTEKKIDSDGEEKTVYKYRPLVIFYDGPEKLNRNISSVRDSKPVIINLNADFRGIIVMENSPMVINGNGHKFNGFVVAKEFVQVKTDADFNNFETLTISGNEYFIEEADFKSKNDIVTIARNKNKTVFIDGDKLFMVPNDKLKNIKNAEDYDTESYVRPAYKPDGKTARTDAGTAVYILETALKRKKLTPIPDGRSNWYDFIEKNDPNKTMYCLDGVDKDILLYSSGWRLVTDIDGNKKLVQNFETAVESTYLKVDKDGNELYIDSNSKYYVKYDMNAGQEHVNSVYVDNSGEIAYKKDASDKYLAIQPTRTNTNRLINAEFHEKDKKIFDYANDFNITESTYDTFGGVVPLRRVYLYLDNGSDDNFFTAERAGWIT